MSIPSGRPSTITSEPTPQSPHIIPSYEDSISYQASLPHSIYIDCLPNSLTKITPTEPSDATLHKKSVGLISIRNLNLVHRYASNIPPIPTSLTPAPCKNLTQFESLNLHHIFGCRKFRNQKHITAATNTSLVNSGLRLSTIGSFANIANPPKGNPIKKQLHYL